MSPWAVLNVQNWTGVFQEVFRLYTKASEEFQSSGAKWAVSRDFIEHSSRLSV